MRDLSGKSILITGAGRGIGRAIALRLAEDGADVAVNDIDEVPAREVAGLVRERGRKSLVSTADVTDEEQVQDMIQRVVVEFGKLDVMISNAGITLTRRLIETSLEEFERVQRVNVRGVFLCGREAAKHMIPLRSGKIINAASTSGRRGAVFQAAYNASKFAVVGLTQCMARELGPFGITANAYGPGIVDTRMWQQINVERSQLLGLPVGGALEEAIKTTALGRMEKPDDVAGVVSFLASSDSDYMTGQTVMVCGGIYMG